MRGKVAVITGSSRGIGEAIAKGFARVGYSIVINSRDQEELSVSKEEILKSKDNAAEIVTFPGDISQEEVCIGLIETAVQEFGRIDVLVNNAGINGPEKKSSDISSSEWDEVLDINLKGCFMCSREAIKKMLMQKGNGGDIDYSIINISSVHESTPMPLAAPYSASKGGMEMLTKTMALEVADKGIRINAIAPGAIATMMNIDILEDEKKMKEEEKKIPMHRIGEPSEIAKVTVFLASSSASYITGTTVYVDGGLTLVS
ncbi:MAG TPA: glucose 1-dehydrogenase [Nitrososphaeraceae archaeon]